MDEWSKDRRKTGSHLDILRLGVRRLRHSATKLRKENEEIIDCLRELHTALLGGGDVKVKDLLQEKTYANELIQTHTSINLTQWTERKGLSFFFLRSRFSFPYTSGSDLDRCVDRKPKSSGEDEPELTLTMSTMSVRS